MHRIRRNNRIYTLLLTCTKRQRILLSISLVACLVASWFLLLYRPLVLRTHTCQHQLNDNTTNATTCQELHTEYSELQQAVNSLEQQAEQYKNESKKKTDYVTTIAKLAHQSIVCIDSCTIEQREDKQEFTYTPLAIQGHGTLAQLTDFFTKISSTYSNAAPSQISLEHMKNNVLQFNCRFNVLGLNT